MNVVVTDREGVAHTLDGEAGWRLMEVIREAGLPVKAECGGSCVCSTCHVYVDEAWQAQLPRLGEEEEETLSDACALRSNSRLSCQIVLASGMHGLAVTMAPDWS